MSAICGKLQIEYCASCGFGQRFINVKREVTSAHKKVTVVGNPSAPRRGAFEVTFVDRDANETLLVIVFFFFFFSMTQNFHFVLLLFVGLNYAVHQIRAISDTAER